LRICGTIAKSVAAKLIIGIHGLNSKPAPGILRDWWMAAIDEGIARNCGERKPRFDFTLAYWADLIYPAPVPLSENPEPYLPGGGSGPLPRADVSVKSVATTLVRESVEKALEKLLSTPLAENIVRNAVETRYPDLHRYKHHPVTRRDVQERLRGALRTAHAQGREIMLIAHSMGSIVAYDVLRRSGRTLPGLRIAHFVTLGSPLGLTGIAEIVAGSLRVPECVARWSNLADPSDYAARWNTRLSDDYRPNRAGVVVFDRLVTNGYVGRSGKPNTHKIYGYLRTPEMSELIADFAAGKEA
jgi:hypothetical protein